jgi:photosystem II stability/assembly factor-like uncharacterized protein
LLAVVVALAFAAVAPRTAQANGRPAAAFDIAFDDNSPRIFVGNTFGGLVSDDGGVTWRLVCEQVLGTANQLVNSVYVSTRAGMLLVSSARGIVYSRDGGCTFTPSAGAIVSQPIYDIAVDPSNPMRVLASSYNPQGTNGIYVSILAVSFAAPNPPGDVGTSFYRVRFSSVNPSVAYTIGVQRNGTVATTLLYRSSDGGTTFTPTGYTATNFAVQPPPTLIGVDPRDENKVYFYANDGSGTEPLFASTDGGMTFTPSSDGWTLLYDGIFSDDGSGTLYLATNQGVRTTSDGGQTFSPARQNATVMRCLRVWDHVLYGCSDILVDGSDFDVGKSTDEGVSWQPLVRFNQNIVGPVMCPAGSQVCVTCYPDWQRFAQQFGLLNTQHAIVPRRRRGRQRRCSGNGATGNSGGAGSNGARTGSAGRCLAGRAPARSGGEILALLVIAAVARGAGEARAQEDHRDAESENRRIVAGASRRLERYLPAPA